MNNATAATVHAISQLTPDEQAGIRDFFNVYEAHYDLIMQAIYQRLRADPAMQQALQKVPVEQIQAQLRLSHDLQQQGVRDGDWRPYLSYLTQVGTQYASTGLSFQSFFGRLGAFRPAAMPYVFEDYAHEPERLRSALLGMNSLADLAMAAVGQAYVDTKEALIRDQAEALRGASERQREDTKFSALLESAPDAMVIVNHQGEIVLVNSQTETVFGYARQALIGRPVEMLVPDRFRGNHRGHRVNYFIEPHVRQMGAGLELYGLRQDGTEFPVEISLSPLETEEGILVTAAIRDITDRKRAEHELRRLKLALDWMAEGAQIISPDWRYLYVNDAVVKQGRSTKEDLIGYTMMEKYPGIDQSPLFETMRRCMEQRTAEHIENPFTFPDGSSGWFDLSIQPSADGIFILSTDITARKLTEAALNESNQRLRSFFETGMLGIMLSTSDNRILEANQEACRMLGYTQDELLRIDSRILSDAADTRVREAIGERERTGQFQGEMTMVRSDGSRFPAEVYSSVIGQGPSGMQNSVLMLDVTERNRAEQAVREKNAELEAANAELEAFSYSVSHDLRAPLRAVIGFSSAVLEDYGSQLDPDGQRQLAVIKSEARNMGALVDDLLAFSRLGRQQMRLVEVDMTALAKDVWADLARQSPERMISVHIGTMPAARGDRTMLKQALMNLMANAFKFTRSRLKAAIEIGSRAGEVETVYFVKDNGVGFDMRYVGKLFGVFQRLHSTEEFEGTGIGLSIVKRVITRHGGRVWAEAQVDAGATVYFALPNKEA